MGAELSDTSCAVLGLVDKKALVSGYELAALTERALGHFWPISRTLVYRELARLERAGMVRGIEVAQRGVPDKRVYDLTASGRQALLEWLNETTLPRTDYRNGFLLKFFFGLRIEPDVLAKLLAEYEQSLRTTVDRLRETVRRLADLPDARMGRLAALHGIRTAEARLAWLRDIEAELDAERSHPLTDPDRSRCRGG